MQTIEFCIKLNNGRDSTEFPAYRGISMKLLKYANYARIKFYTEKVKYGVYILLRLALQPFVKARKKYVCHCFPLNSGDFLPVTQVIIFIKQPQSRFVDVGRR